jgi:tRNA1(Val) A37 N6-methylase TrmN6
VLDLGCGCGVIGLILAYRHVDCTVIGLELQAELARLAGDNYRRNNLADRCTVIQGDVRSIDTLMRPESVDLVVCNPPYQKQGNGRINPDVQAALARHELHGAIEDFVRAAAFCVRNRGRAVFVYPARRAIALLTACTRHRLAPKRLQPVYSWPEAANARLVLVEARKNGGEEVEVLAPWYIYERRHGAYTPAMRHLYEE